MRATIALSVVLLLAGCNSSDDSASSDLSVSPSPIDLANTDIFLSYLPHNGRPISCGASTCLQAQVCCMTATGDYCGYPLGMYCGESGYLWSDCAVDEDCLTGLVCCPLTV